VCHCSNVLDHDVSFCPKKQTNLALIHQGNVANDVEEATNEFDKPGLKFSLM